MKRSTWFSSFCLWSPAVMAALFLISCGGEKTPPEPGVKAVSETGTGLPDPDGVAVEESKAGTPELAPGAQPANVKEEKETKVDDSIPSPAALDLAAKTPMKEGKVVAEGKEVATLGGGCFWCTEAVIERLDGVTDVVSGYMGGHVENPTYEQICTKTTGHAEVIEVTFDPKVITFEEILDVFWQAHDPTTLNQQGADRGPQYRSVIFYHSPEQRNIASQSMKKLNDSGTYPDPAVTEISAATKFWVAEEYHQNYYELNKDSNPYCRAVISPKLKKLGME